MTKKTSTIQKEDLVVKFAGDSGDGMQLTGTFFSEASALLGNDLATFPDFPAEIRAPHNTIPGVSGFLVRIGQTKIYTPGDLCDVLIAMNPASLKSNLKWAKKGATLIVNEDTFNDDSIAKAGYTTSPLTDGSLQGYHLIAAPVTTLTKAALEDMGIDLKTMDRSKNMFVLGMLCFITDRGTENVLHLFDKKFAERPKIKEINRRTFLAGFNYAETAEIVESVITVPPAKGAGLEKGRYRNITGNDATAWGLLAAAEKCGRPLFLGSYPITPATEILYELAKHKSLGARVFQAEDEIAGICSAIGASFAGAMACTTTSGPGLSLKSEALGLAVITELPIVIVNVQRAGPSTGIPTKSEQADLNQALFGRNGEAPLVVMSASSPADCFYAAFEASRISMETMTPVILLTDGYMGFGSELFRIPKMADLPQIHPPIAKANDPNYQPYKRDENLIRQWAIPGTEGLRHRIGGLEKEDGKGNVSSDPHNHQKMVNLRRDKVLKIADRIPLQDVIGEETGDLLVVSWGGTRGATFQAVQEMQAQGKKVSLAHFRHIFPYPKNTEKILKSFKRVIVPEINDGQFVNFLRMNFQDVRFAQYNKVQGLPFTVSELIEAFTKVMEGK